MGKTDILEHIEWARQTIKDKEMFGLDPLNASFSRERRASGALLSAKQAIEELRKELTYYKSKGLLTPKDVLKENEELKNQVMRLRADNEWQIERNHGNTLMYADENKKLKELIDTFIVHSNGLSIWARIASKKEGLPKDLADDIQDLYDYQCHVEDEINKFGDQNDKDNSIH